MWRSWWVDGRTPTDIGAPLTGSFEKGIGTLVGEGTRSAMVAHRVRAPRAGSRPARATAANGKRTGSRTSNGRPDMRVIASVALVLFAIACTARDTASPKIEISDDVEEFAPGIASTRYSDVHLTLSPDGNTALWFSRNRPGGPGGYDIWMSRRKDARWSTAQPVSFNTPSRDFDPAFSRDGRFVYFASDRPGGAGGDDLYRVAVTATGFGRVESLGAEVNSTRNEWAPMLAPDGRTLLFSSDGHAGAGRMDLFTARRSGKRFGDVRALPGAVNTDADEFDATYLADGRTVIFSRSPDLETIDVRLYCAQWIRGTYGAGHVLFEESKHTGQQHLCADARLVRSGSRHVHHAPSGGQPARRGPFQGYDEPSDDCNAAHRPDLVLRARLRADRRALLRVLRVHHDGARTHRPGGRSRRDELHQRRDPALAVHAVLLRHHARQPGAGDRGRHRTPVAARRRRHPLRPRHVRRDDGAQRAAQQ